MHVRMIGMDNWKKVQYQTLDLDDYEAWQSQYLLPGSGGLNEYVVLSEHCLCPALQTQQK